MDFSKKEYVRGRVLNGRYEILSPLNHGSFGMVVMARDRSTGKRVALKCLSKPSAAIDSSFSIDDRSEELQIHSRIGHHPNIVNLLGSFETETNIYLVLEYCSMGDLYEAIRQDKGPKETEHVREFMLQLVDALQSLHDKGIYHRDIKPENIFLTETGKMKLGDFGLATTDAWSYEAAVGSDRYMAPEQYDPADNGLSPAKADIWSLGICLLNILFSRNPFGVPAMSDTLFADYVRDRQSLFDVFHRMSQDTFEVLVHCLAIDPAKRSLSLVKEALERVISFTTDDESLDEFCTENRDVLTATANREPLRTPSISSPMMSGESFPWASALQMTSPKPRQLSVIEDNETVSEDLFPDSEVSTHDWYSKADTYSLNSTVDSGLGVSVDSSDHHQSNSPAARSRPVLIASSLPTLSGKGASRLASFFGKKARFESKSWSDLWEEEEEEREQLEREKTIECPQATRLSTLSQVDSEDDGRSTPRACLAELKTSSAINARNPSIHSNHSTGKDERISEQTGFIFDDHTASALQRVSSPVRRSLIDKWAALGEIRRNTHNTNVAAKGVPSSLESNKHRFGAGTWRRSFGKGLPRPTSQQIDHSVWQQQEWSKSKDWRRSQQNLAGSPLRPHSSQLDGGSDNEAAVESDEEWIGGWKDIQL